MESKYIQDLFVIDGDVKEGIHGLSLCEYVVRGGDRVGFLLIYHHKHTSVSLSCSGGLGSGSVV